MPLYFTGKGYGMIETLAKGLLQKINDICIGYYYLKRTDAVEKGMELSDNLQCFASILLKENIFDTTEEEQAGFRSYILQALKDYAQAVIHGDIVLMVDTLDYGFRNLLMIFADANNGEREYE